MKFSKKLFIIIIALLITLLLNNIVYGQDVKTENKGYSKAYLEYLELSEEEKAKVNVIPRKYDVPFDVLYEKKEEKSFIKRTLNKVKSLFGVNNNEVIPSSFILLKDENTDIECERYGGIDIQVENQGDDGLCWDFTSITALETNLALHGLDYDLSERHLDYLTSFEFGGERELNGGGNFDIFKEYVKKTYGPVSEYDVPYNKTYSKEEYEYLQNLEPIVYVGETVDFPCIEKSNKNYTEEELNYFRDEVKKHIINHGGVYAGIAVTALTEYNNKYVLNSKETQTLNDGHAVTIIGWDDNFSVENFPEEYKPSSPGAYIALNSWGNDWGDNGIFYISYEDVNVEVEMSGIIKSSIENNNFETICFEDENLYNHIKNVLSKEIVSYNDLEKIICIKKISIDNLNELYLNNINIEDLTGIERFTNLKTLDISNNHISNIGCLQNLNYLIKLNISNNEITNISYLHDLIHLQELDISNNNVSDISSLPDNHYIELNLSGNNITILTNNDINVTRIYLDNCNIDNNMIQEIHQKLPDFLELSLKNNNITDCSSIVYDGREKIDLSNNPIDPRKIPTAPTLILNNCNITEVNDIANNFTGSSLSLCNNPIEDISPLATLNLYKLCISNTNVGDVSGLTKLQYLDISGNVNVTGLNNLSNLKSLAVNNCNLTNENLTEITSNLNNLEYLSVNNNKINNLDFLSNCNNLNTLYASSNEINDITGLTNITAFNELDLSNNNIDDITCLENIIYIGNLNISNNNIKNILIFDKIRILDNVDISNNKITDVGLALGSNIPYNRLMAKNQEISFEIDIEKDKEYEFILPDIINEAYKNGMYDTFVELDCQNCTINSIGTKIKIQSDTLGNGEASIVVHGGSFDGSIYKINYNTVESINVESIRVKSNPYRQYYIENENFDTNGLIVEVTYENGFIENTTEYNILDGENLFIGQTAVTITSKKNPEIKTTLNIIVYAEDELVKVQFPDSNLYNAIKNGSAFLSTSREILDGMIVRYDDETNEIIMLKNKVEQIRNLTLNNKNITDISGIENFINIEDISLGRNQNLENIEQLKYFNKLKNVYIYQTKVDDIGELLNKESINTISLDRSDNEIIRTNKNIIELPKFIYQSLTMQENVNADAYIFYEVEYSDEINSYWCTNQENKSNIEVNLDTEKQIATIELDKEVTEEKEVGIRKIEITIRGGKTDKSCYEVCYEVEAELQNLEITKEPTKLNYAQGQNFEEAGMIITAIYNDGSSKEITDYVVEDGENLTGERNYVTITYTDNEITKTVKQQIKVYSNEEVVNVKFPDNNFYNAMKDKSALQESGKNVYNNLIVGYNDNENTVLMVKEIVQEVQFIYLMQKDIRDISGIENFTNLKSVILSHNLNLESIDKLLLLDNIEYIEAHITKVQDIGQFLNKDSIRKITLRQDDQNIINASMKEIVLPQYIYQSLTMQENVTAEAYIYYNPQSYEDYYFNELDGEKKLTEIKIDTEKQIATAVLDKELTEDKNVGIRGIEITIKGGKTDGGLYIAFYNNLDKIEVTSAPRKVKYFVGQSFNPTDMVVTATYKDESKVEITDYTVVDGSDLSLEKTNVTISYTENGITKTTTQEISVEEVCEHIWDEGRITLNATCIDKGKKLYTCTECGETREEEITALGHEYNNDECIRCGEKIFMENSTYSTSQTILTGINPNTLISEFLNNIRTRFNVSIIKDGETITEGKIGTGMRVQIKENENLVGNYFAIVVGDCNGDGESNIKDMVKINNYRLYGTTTNFDEIYQEASDVNKDGKIDVKDMVRINNYRLYGTEF